MNENFKNQIDEDIMNLKKEYRKDENPDSNDWWFNFWILEKLFYMDGELIFDNITENNDSGVDSFFYDKESNDLFLIQNKYYNESSNVSITDLKYFLENPLQVLAGNKYTRKPELQKVYNDMKGNSEFTVHFMFNVTSNIKSDEIENEIKRFNQNNSNIAYFNDINSLKDLYYNYEGEKRKEFKIDFETINKGTILNINNNDYGTNLNIDARFVMTNVAFIFKLIEKANKENYPIFDENIREYLGQNAINKKIKNTLIDDIDRKNFFYYNNGITIVCDDFSPANKKFEVNNPQIVNGCQTSSTIYETLKDYENIDTLFQDSFVMVKLLKVDKSENLLKSIVLYNNSQNKVDEKNLEAQRKELQRIREEFNRRGLFLLLKQSDKYKLKEKYGSQKLNSLDISLSEKFSNLLSPQKISDLEVPIEKLLQVILCYIADAHKAYIEKSKLLKTNSKINKMVMEEIVNNPQNTLETYYNLWILYKYLENYKKIDDKIIPFYVLMCINKFITEGSSRKLNELVQNRSDIDYFIKFYMKAIRNVYQKNINLETNTMIKSPIKEEILINAVNETSLMLDDYLTIKEKY